ncbi:MAG: gliding motility-associated-like protein [Paraglaciecola sp.]|jgi:gliding motility-associated-like protein
MAKLFYLKKAVLWSVLFLGASSTILAQDLGLMECTDGATFPYTPENLIEQIFLGDGVEVTNITFDGDPAAVGFFNHGLDEIGIQRGIIMSTGRACNQGLAGPFGIDGVGNGFASSDMNSAVQDADLSAIAVTSATNDVARYSITFIPTSDTLQFKYVFASEEYPEWACSNFNDVFGFFISGPGINGPLSNNGENIALVPGTNTPVAISNVHPVNGAGCPPEFEEYYNDNNGTALQPVYDGVLDVFVAQAIVTPCEEYTIKLVIGDGGDNVFDSGVFLEAKSFGTGTLDVTAATVSLDGTITESCSDGVLTFELPNPAEEDFFIDYTIFGTAINGVDYETIPLDLFIAAGDTAVTISIVAIPDDLDEGVESIGIDVQRDVCNRDTFYIFIRDNEILSPNLGPDTLICRGDSVQLDGTLPIPLPVPPSFTNETDYEIPNAPNIPVYSDNLVFGVQPVYLQDGVIESVCINITHKFLDDLDLFLFSPGGQFIELSTDNGQDCDNYYNTCFVPGATTNLQDIVPLGYDCAASEQSGFIGDFAIEGVWSDLWPNDESPTNGVWQLLVIDDSQGFFGTIDDWTITFKPLYQIEYRWEPSLGLSCDECPDPVATPEVTTTYFLTAFDTYGCEVYDSITIEVKDVLDAPNVFCSTITNNSINFEWDDVPGSNNYEVSIDGGPWMAPNGSLEHLASGLTLSDTITFLVRGIGECDGDEGQVICWTPDCNAPDLMVDNFTVVGCNGGNDGTLTVSAMGGSGGGGYTFTVGSQSNATGVFMGLEAGLYEIAVTDNLNCSNVVQLMITEPDTLAVSIDLVSEISCNAIADGSLSAVLMGGSYPYTFDWNGAQVDSVATGLAVGMQTVIITDAEGCTATADYDLPEPTAISFTTDSTLVNCFDGNDGTATIAPMGGTGDFTYAWDVTANNQATDIATSLAAGIYTVEITDVNGCSEIALITVNQPTELEISLAGTNLDCFESDNGIAIVTAMGGTPDMAGAYTYDWVLGQNTADLSNLAAGTYPVLVEDANGCVQIDSVQITQPEEMSLMMTPVDVNCNTGTDGEVMAEAMGGDGNYTYEWSNLSVTQNISSLTADNYCVTVTDGNGCSVTNCMDVNEPAAIVLSTATTTAGCNGGTDGTINLTIEGGSGMISVSWDIGSNDEDLDQLPAGTYVATVEDENNCTAAITVEIADSDEIQSSLSSEDVNCFGGNDGSIDLEVMGGMGNFTYNWTGPNGYTFTGQDPVDLETGDYEVSFQDDQGCSQVLAMTINQPATGVELSIPTTDMICFNTTDGAAIVNAIGGAGNYSYEWSSGSNTANANTLNAGNYTVTVTDQNGCSSMESVEIVQQEELSFSLTQTGADCFNGADGTAAIAQVTYGVTSANIADFDINWSASGQSTTSIDDLTGGQNYGVTVTDALGCIATNDITIINPAEIGASAAIQAIVSCAQGDDGVVIAAGDGGTAPYSFQWGANAAEQSTAVASELPAGMYIATVTDANGCFTTTDVELTNPTPISVDFNSTPVICNGEANGTAIANVAGGQAPYNYVWQDGQTTEEATSLFGGEQQVTITDSFGCELEAATMIPQPDQPLTAQHDVEDVTCFGDRNGQIFMFPEGGTAPYTYSLDGENFFGSSTLIALPAGGQVVTVKDSRGCLFVKNGITIGEPAELTIDLGTNINLEYDLDAFLDTEITGAIPGSNLMYQWTKSDSMAFLATPNESGSTIRIFNPTTFTITVIDENGCEAEDAIVVFLDTPRAVVVPTGFSPDGNDALNQGLHVHGRSRLVDEISSFQVFDRWGEQVYEANNFGINDTSVGWDGTFAGEALMSGVYVWVVEVVYVDGRTEVLRGHTTLIR